MFPLNWFNQSRLQTVHGYTGRYGWSKRQVVSLKINIEYKFDKDEKRDKIITEKPNKFH